MSGTKSKDWVRVNLSLSREFYRRLREFANKDKRSVSNEIEILCSKIMDNQDSKES